MFQRTFPHFPYAGVLLPGEKESWSNPARDLFTPPGSAGDDLSYGRDAGVIEPAGYGFVDFAIPGLREYITAHPSND
jgi:hypothetical protein